MDRIIIDGLSFSLPLFIMAIGGIYSEKSGIIPRRILLHFFNRKNYMAVNLICRLSYVVLHKVR